MNTLTVVIQRGDPRDAAVREIAARWSAAGLLTESVWLTPDDVRIPESGPPHVAAHLVGDGGEGEAQDLFSLVAVRRLDLVRIVALNLLPHGEEHDAALSEVAGRVARLVKSTLPRDVTLPQGSGTALVRINLLVPETGTGEVGRELLARDWEVNALASPEDRPDLHHASIFVRSGVNLHAHAMAAVACVGGLWSGVAQGAFDDIEVDSTGSESDLVVFRPSARVLLGDVLPQRLADSAITLVQDPAGEGAATYVPWAAVAQTPEEDVERAHTELIARGEWARDPLAEMDPLPKLELSIGAAFSDLARFQWRLVLAAGRVIRNTATRWVENRATQMTVGSEGGYVVRVEPRTPDQLLALAQERLEEQTANLQAGLLKREAVKHQPPMPSTWVEVRRLCFGLVDGSALPDGFTPPERASTREILSPRWIVPRPEDAFRTADGTVVGPVDIDGAVSLQASLTGADAESDASDGIDVTETNDATAHGSGPAQAVEELQDWVARREGALLWRLGRTVWHREHQAHETSEAAYKRAVEDSVPGVADVRRARKRLLWCWAIIGLASLGAGLWTAWKYWVTETLTVEGFARGLSTLTLLNLVLAVLGGWQYYRALSRFERQVQYRLADRRHAAEVYVVASRETRRLGLLYRGVMEWAEVIGWVIHHPWAPRPNAASESDLDLKDLPASVAMAVPAPESNELPRALTQEALTLLCNRGWTKQVFDEIVAAVEDSRGPRHADRGHLPADLDSGVTNDGARRQLVSAVASGELRAALADAARQRVSDAVGNGTLKLPVRRVVRLGHYASPDPMSDAEFFRGALGSATPFVEELWTPQGMHDRRHLASRSVAWMPVSRAEDGGSIEVRDSAGDVSVRVDMSRSCDPAQIALFRAAPRVARPRAVASGEKWL